MRLIAVALAAWLGGGAIAFGAGHARYGLTPSLAWLAVALAGAAIVRRTLVPLLALVLLLPWLPVRVPDAWLVWSGHAAAWVGALIGLAVAAPWLRRTIPTDPARAKVAAFGAAAVLFLASAGLVAPQLPAGDEPHYLVIAQTLLNDHGLQIERTHRRGDYHAYFAGDLRPDYLTRGTNGAIYSIHAPGLPALVAPFFALAGYRGVIVFLALVAAAASAIAWHVAFLVTGSAAAAWFGWGVVTLSEPFFVQSFMVYPDAPSGAIVMVAVATMVLGRRASRARLAWTGMALAMLPWLHTRAVLLAFPLGAVLAWRQFETDGDGTRSAPRIAALAVAPLASAILWFAFFWTVYGTPDPRAPYGGAQQMAVGALPRGAIGLLFDQQFGLLANAPVYLVALLGAIPLAKRAPRVAIELAIALTPYAIAVAAFQMWWAGYTTPARFLVPVLLPLSIPAAVWFDRARHRAARSAAVALLAVSVAITASVVGVGRGVLLLNFRDGASRLLTWLSSSVDLTTAVPSLFQSTPERVVGEAALWLAAAAAVLALTRVAAVHRLDRDRRVLLVGAASLVATTMAVAAVWGTKGARAETAEAGALAYLRQYDGDARQVAVSLSPLRRVRRIDVPPRLPLADAAPVDGEPLVDLRHVPAATYAIDLTLSRAASGGVTVALDRALGPAWAFDVSGATGRWHQEFFVPIASPTLRIDATPALRSAIDHVALRATSVPGSQHRMASDEADHVARYGRTLLFQLGGDAYMEPGGTWVKGGSSAEFALVDDARRPVELVIRTSPVANEVSLDGDGWHQRLTLAPGASTTVVVPIDRLRVSVSAGARPADFEPGSTDVRFLGVWIEAR